MRTGEPRLVLNPYPAVVTVVSHTDQAMAGCNRATVKTQKSGATVMKKIPTREPPPQPSEQPQPRHRSAYDYDGEYEFPFARHWTAPKADRAD
jgi:hypothetical protein